jgi:NitT/TauT family transport system permease protein
MQRAKNQKQIHRYRRHVVVSYPTTLSQRLYSAFAGPIIFVALSFAILKLFPLASVHVGLVTHVSSLFTAVFATFLRLLIAYVLALVCAIPLALLINYNARAERILLPLFDITQSIPVLAFFPVVIFLFVKYGLFNGAAIFILFLTMIWSIIFSVVGGLSSIPSDIIDAAHVFHIRKSAYVRKVLLPAIFPYIITGSLLAWASGWNIVIVAEVLHTYIPNGTPNQDLFGIGSSLVNAIASGRSDLFLAAIIVMVVTIGFLNIFVWQRLLHYGERFKFD